MWKNCLELFPNHIEIVGVYNSSDDINHFLQDKKDAKNISLYKYDILIEDEVKNMIKKIGNDFTHCIYLASNVNVGLSIQEPQKDLIMNAVSLINLLKH